MNQTDIRCFRNSMILSLIVLSIVTSMPVLAQNTGGAILEEVVVTATRRGESSIQDTAIALSAFGGEELIRAGVSDISGIADLTPGLQFTSNGNWTQISIRGISTNNTFVGGDPSTAVHMDGVYIGRPSAAFFDMTDVDRVEVLRGPQGTLYGRNATAGTINIHTRDPGDEFDANFRAGYGEEDYKLFEGAIGGPLSDKVSVRLAGRITDRDPYINNVSPGGPDVWSEERQYVRGKFLFKPNDDLDIVLSVDYTHIDESPNFVVHESLSVLPDGFTTTNVHETAINDSTNLDWEGWGFSGRIVWNFNDLVFTSITAYREHDMNVSIDLDSTNLNMLHTRAFPEKAEQVSQEFTVTGSSDRLNWVGGAFLFWEDGETFFNLEGFGVLPGLDFLQTQGSKQDTSSYAVFAEGTYNVSERISVTAGIRYTHDNKEQLNDAGFDVFPAGTLPVEDPMNRPVSTTEFPREEKSFSAWTPKFGVEFRPTDGLLLYGSVTRGFKSGGYNLIAANTPVEYDEELVWSYEAGIKKTFNDGRLQLAATGFYYDYSDFQVVEFQGAGTEFVVNAESVEVSGAELEIRAVPVDRLVLAGSLAYLDTKYDSSFITTDTSIGTQLDARGNELSNSPEITASLVGEYSWDFAGGSIALRGEVIHKGKVFYEPSNNEFVAGDDYTLLNARLAYTTADGHWEAALHGRNLTDKEHVTGATSFVAPVVRPGIPRTWLATISYRY